MIKEAMEFIAALKEAALAPKVLAGNVPWRSWVMTPEGLVKREAEASVSHTAGSPLDFAGLVNQREFKGPVLLSEYALVCWSADHRESVKIAFDHSQQFVWMCGLTRNAKELSQRELCSLLLGVLRVPRDRVMMFRNINLKQATEVQAKTEGLRDSLDRSVDRAIQGSGLMDLPVDLFCPFKPFTNLPSMFSASDDGYEVRLIVDFDWEKTLFLLRVDDESLAEVMGLILGRIGEGVAGILRELGMSNTVILGSALVSG